MELIYPSYYKAFSCIASACPDSCCHEWEVQVDAESAERYRSMEGELGDALRSYLYDEDGETYLRNEHGRCPMWRADGLCRIQVERGHDELCTVCQQFPRLRHDYGDFLELGLELSCPEAARLILETPLELVTESVPGGEAPEYDSEIMEILRQSRPTALALLEHDRYSVPERLRLLLMLGCHVQAAIDGAELLPFDPDSALVEAAQFAGAPDPEALAQVYRELESLTRRWQEKLDSLTKPLWDEGLCRIAQYGICRHWYQAVSDWDLTSRVKMLLSGCALLARLPGSLRDNAQLWSKEIENSTENLNVLLDGAYTRSGLTDANLLGLLG
ncbi:MAG: flagellin lysine-N-methylase [Oscillospiraceae bacterium]|nr:flagellin lysine-N-methylase [Oscillospiraceae bacterium]